MNPLMKAADNWRQAWRSYNALTKFLPFFCFLSIVSLIKFRSIVLNWHGDLIRNQIETQVTKICNATETKAKF